MKELEALKRLRDGYTNGYYKQFTHSEAKIDEDYNMVLEALTPPTADELCKAMSNYFKKWNSSGYRTSTIEYKSYLKAFFFLSGGDKKEDRGKDKTICFMESFLGDTHIRFFEDLPPHLITLIGRFYEGVEKK
jgi:1,4-dihydroxy-2-naphthoyl-CoA synthase